MLLDMVMWGLPVEVIDDVERPSGFLIQRMKSMLQFRLGDQWLEARAV